LGTIGCAAPPAPGRAGGLAAAGGGGGLCAAFLLSPAASLFPLQAYVVLNLTADLRSEFTWNTKQLFVHVDVEFATRKNARNQMAMWSAIIQDKVCALGWLTLCWMAACAWMPGWHVPSGMMLQ
jgi:hypothetical protein